VVNGVSVSMTTLTDELEAQGHEVYIFAPAFPGHEDHNSNVIRFPSVRTWFKRDYPIAIPFLPGLKRRLRDIGLDVIHTQTPFVLGSLGLKLGRRLGIPVVSTSHTQYAEYVHYFPLAPRNASRAFIIGMLRRYYNRCDAVIVPSEAQARDLRHFGVRPRIHVIPSGNSLDTSRDPQERALIRSRQNIPQDSRVLMYAGRLAREKNLDLLIKAFGLVAEKHPDVYLLIVGSGPYEGECRRLASGLKSKDRLIFVGFVPREPLAKYYSAADLFAFPSMTETQGLVLTEALRAGLPCVAVRAGGSPEMLSEGEDSLLAENSIEDFAEKIDCLLSDLATMERFSATAIENSARFTPAAMAAGVLRVYEEVRAKG
jgi:1,2-diacylglycerol 3-alpha-glucosyltransferase